MSSLVRRGSDHQDKALLRRRELRNIVVRMGPTDVLLHGAITLLLKGSMIVRCEDQDNEPGRRAKEPLILIYPLPSCSRTAGPSHTAATRPTCIKWGARRRPSGRGHGRAGEKRESRHSHPDIFSDNWTRRYSSRDRRLHYWRR